MLVNPPKKLDNNDLRLIRRSLGLKQSALAEAIGVDQATVSRWENGQNPIDPQVFTRLLVDLNLASGSCGQQLPLQNVAVDDNWPSLIRYYRVTRGLTLDQLAGLLAVDGSTVFRWESGIYRPCLGQQRRLRDLLLKPLDSSAQFARLRQRILRSRGKMSLLIGQLLIVRSLPLTQLDRTHGYDIPDFSNTDEMYEGRLRAWMDARWQAGFFKGDVAKSEAYYRLSDHDARVMLALPVQIEDGRVLTVGFQRSVNPKSLVGTDGEFRIHHCDEMIG